MSTSFSRKFLEFTEGVVNSLAGPTKTGGQASRVAKSALSPGAILPGDVLFFSYHSEKFKDGEHLVLVVRNKRGKYGIFTHMNREGKNKGRAKKYLSAVKLNNVWSQTAKMIISLYNQSVQKQIKDVKYTKKQYDVFKKGLMALVGRKNYRTYILNNMTNTFEVNKGEIDTTTEDEE
jgi:hypothetical protein